MTELPVLNRWALWTYAERDGRPMGYERFCRMYGLEMEQKPKSKAAREVVCTIDFETRSVCELLDTGAWIYARHPTTQVLCLSYKLPGQQTKLWHRAHPKVGIEQSPFPQDLADWILAGKLVEAHNAGFEAYVWEFCFLKEFPEFPKLFADQMRCSAAKAAQFALPRDLAGACDAMKLPIRKNLDGKKVMLRVSKLPPKYKEKELVAFSAKVEMGLMDVNDLPWNEDLNDLRVTWAYNVNDVDAEEGLSSRLRDMSPREIEFWQMDQRMNRRGVKIDLEGVKAAVDMSAGAADLLNSRIREITCGDVPKGSSRIKLKRWANEHGFPIQNTQADHIKEVLAHLRGKMQTDAGRAVIECMELCMDVNQTSTSKYKQMLVMVDADHRIRDLMLYYGAARTGRWSGKGVQPHNFLRGFKKDMEFAWQQIMAAYHEPDMDRLAILFGSAMKALSKATRGALIADEGKDFLVADFAAIEARVLPWLAQDEKTLDIFHSGADIYLKLAADIYAADPGCAFSKAVAPLMADPLNKKLRDFIKEHFPVERQLGKKGILGLGFGMGDEKFDDECAAEDPPIDMPRAFFKKVVKTYREESFPLISSFWPELNETAVMAINHKGKRFDCRSVAYKVVGDFLHCELPSGRLLSYHYPTVATSRTYIWQAKSKQGKEATIRINVPPGTEPPEAYRRACITARAAEKTIINGNEFEKRDQDAIWFSGQNQKTKQYERMTTYGGSLAENITQAAARDFMAEAMLRCDDDPMYDMLLSIHDELIAEVDEDKGDVKEFEELMSVLPGWADGDLKCPVAAEGWRGKRYRK